MSSSHGEVGIWLVDSLLQHSAFLFFFSLKQCIIKQLLDSAFVIIISGIIKVIIKIGIIKIEVFQISQKPHLIIV